MIPIGIVTRNRHHYLDVTLRSLSAAHLPDDQVLVVFDDASDDNATMRYLYTDDKMSLAHKWPKGSNWRRINLNEVWSRKTGRGISSKVPVVRLGDTKQGVVNACCQGLTRLFDMVPNKILNESGLLLIQDDVIFNEDAMARLLAQAANPMSGELPIGLLMGCCINNSNKQKRAPTRVTARGVTAQCAYILPAAVSAVRKWANSPYTRWTGFDNKLCACIRSSGHSVYRCHPAICQHIGIVSGVRPSWRWTRVNRKGRVDYSAKGPYPLCEDVRQFMKGRAICLS